MKRILPVVASVALLLGTMWYLFLRNAKAIARGTRDAVKPHKGNAMHGYCMKCKEKREMKDVKPVTMKNGRQAHEGVCPECGTRMFKIGAGETKAVAQAKAETKKAVLKAAKKGKSKKAEGK